jgi:hypothetical protein
MHRQRSSSTTASVSSFHGLRRSHPSRNAVQERGWSGRNSRTSRRRLSDSVSCGSPLRPADGCHGFMPSRKSLASRCSTGIARSLTN